MPQPPELVLPEPMTRFACNLQGCCCRGWVIPFTPDDVVRLAVALPEEERGRLATDARVVENADETHTMLLRGVGDDARCRFLEGDGRCEVHGRLGEAALPQICVNFPVVPLRESDALTLYFDPTCPEVLERLAEGPGPMETARRPVADLPSMAGRARGGRAPGPVLVADRPMGSEAVHRLAAGILAALADESRPLLEAIADVSYAVAAVAAGGPIPARIPAVGDRGAFYGFFRAAIDAHGASVLASSLRAYRRFVFDLPLEDARWEGLEAALSAWEPAYRARVLPAIPEWLLRRFLQNQYATAFERLGGRVDVAAATVIHTQALALRFMAGLCEVLDRTVDVPVAKAALGGAEHFYRNLRQTVPHAALPWFQP